MLAVIRKNQHSLTFFIVLLTIISFIWLYNRTNLSQVGTNDVATVYGHVVQRAEIERNVRNYHLAMALGLTDFVRDLGGFAENEEMAITSFIFNVLVIQHEAPRLHVVPTDENIATMIQGLSLFQTDGVFDSAKYARFMKEQLLPRGFTERQLEEVVRDALSFKKLQELITAPVVVSEAQVREAARLYQPVVAQVLRFDESSYFNNLKEAITPAEKKEFYEKNKNFFVSEEERAVSYLLFALPSNQQKLQGKDRIKAIQQLSDAATAFKQQNQEAEQQGKKFEKNAADHGLNVITTDHFKKKETTEANNQKAKVIPPELVGISFKLAHVGDVSEVIQSGEKFYLVSLTHITPSRTLTFAEVDSKIEKILREQKAMQKAQEAATKALHALKEAMNSGKKFSEASAALGQKPLQLSGSVADVAKLSLEQQQFLMATLPLSNGELSDVHPAPWGNFIIYLEQRMPLSSAAWDAHHATIEHELADQESNLLFFEWLRQARSEAKITMLDGRHHRSLLSSIFGK